MPKVYSYTQPLDVDALDAFCQLQKGFADQFVYYDKNAPHHYMGLGRCIAVDSMSEIEYICQGPSEEAPILFTFKRFDESNPKPADEMFSTFPHLRFMLTELVVFENERGRFLQVNSLGPVYQGRSDRFVRQAQQAPKRTRRTVGYTVEPDSLPQWQEEMNQALSAIRSGRVDKVVLSRRQFVRADEPFSSKDLLVNLIDGSARGTVFMYRYGDVFFLGCTPELLIRKNGNTVESMCLAGTIGVGENEQQRQQLAEQLLNDEKNLNEHAFVVDFLRQVTSRNCYNVAIPTSPSIQSLTHVQHLHTPVKAQVMEGRSVQNLAGQLHPTPALAGTPVGEALMLIRQIEPYNRGFFGGSVGYVDGNGNGEFSVAIRSGVFDGECGWVYAGCGIVEGSDALSEYEEIDMKLQTILSAFDGGE